MSNPYDSILQPKEHRAWEQGHACQTVAPPPDVYALLAQLCSVALNEKIADHMPFGLVDQVKDYLRRGAAPAVSTPLDEYIDIPFCDSPCGHSSQYAWSEDGGAHIICLICERGAAVSTPRCPTEIDLKKWSERIALATINSRDREGRQQTTKHVLGQLRDFVAQFFHPAPLPPFFPMATAPKDGTEVLLRVKSRAGIPGKYLVGHWQPGGHCIEDHPPIDSGWYFWNGCMFDKAAEPIEWRPLP